MGKLNVTLVEGYPSRALEAGGLQKDQYVKVSKSQLMWYRQHPSTYKTADTVSWGNKFVELNSSYSRIGCSSGSAAPAPASRPLNGHLTSIDFKDAY